VRDQASDSYKDSGTINYSFVYFNIYTKADYLNTYGTDKHNGVHEDSTESIGQGHINMNRAIIYINGMFPHTFCLLYPVRANLGTSHHFPELNCPDLAILLNTW
jgi:hypothetical protein